MEVMRTVKVELNNPYPILFGNGGLELLGEVVKEYTRAEKTLVVTDSNVEKLYLNKAVASLERFGFKVYDFVFEAGERSKNTTTYLDIIDCLGRYGFKRTDAVVALGGGVVGDVAGFAAATYMRGIDVIQTPTTLLAMIDSSIGGKTGVDLEYGKNLLGAFWQPKAVLIDESTLYSLPKKEWKNGIGEGIKYACLAGGRILEILSGNLEKNISEFVELCAKYKADIVAADEKEGGLRKLLNLGHTVGHAIEKKSDYTLSHGVAVAMGIAHMAVAAYRCGELSKAEYETICGLLDKYGMYEEPRRLEIAETIAMDKKAEGANEISAVVINGLGDCKVRKMTINEFDTYINGR